MCLHLLPENLLAKMSQLFQALIAVPKLVSLITQAYEWIGAELDKAKMNAAIKKAASIKDTSDLDKMFNS